MKIKSIITNIALILVSVIVLSACDLFGNNNPPAPTPPPPPIVTPEPKLEVFSKHFTDGVTISYREEVDTLNDDDITGTKNQLIDYQVSTFTDNLLRRLLAVYGPGLHWDETLNNGETIAHLSLIGNPEESYSPNTLSSRDIIMKPTYIDSDVGRLADALKTGHWDASKSIVSKYNLINTMSNWNFSLTNTSNEISVTKEKEAYDTYLEQHFNNIKLGVLKAVTKSTLNNYDSIINSITEFNITASDQTSISNYILNTVMGTTAKNTHAVNDALIRQIVKTTHESTTWTKLDFVKRFNNQLATISNRQIPFKKYNSVIIHPKTSTPITRLNMRVNSQNNSSLTGLRMTTNIYINGTLRGSKTYNITNNQAFTVELHEFSGSYKLFSGSNSYVEFSFNNSTETPFNLTFEGYYDKVK